MADSAYFVAPDHPGPGVLVLHSWWGLTAFFRRFADRLAEEGYTVLVPDLNQGQVFDDPLLAESRLQDADADHLARLTLTSAGLVEDKASGGPIGVVGFSMGASLALWASVRAAETVGAVSAFYGTQSIEFSGARSAYQLHRGADDAMVSPDEMAFLEATIGLEGLAVESFVYDSVGHWFFESDRPDYDASAAELAWDRTRRFLDLHLRRPPVSQE